LLVIGNIHSGECDGKEAILVLLREIALNAQHPWLKNMVTIWVPNYNADANDKMDLKNRPGQVGPDNGMGRRETAQNFDLNRDFMKLDSPEARAMIGLIDRVNPDMFIDCHTTNGSKHQYQLTYDIPHNPCSPAKIREYMREKMMLDITDRLWEKGLRTFYYGNFDRGNTAWTTYGFEPRYSTEYVGLRGKLAILSESYSYLDYKGRIDATRLFVSECADYFSRNKDDIKSMVRSESEQWVQRTCVTGCDVQVALDAELLPFDEPYVLKGFDGEEPKDYTVKFFSRYVPTIQRKVPNAYVIPKALTNIVEKLRLHGIVVDELAEEWSGKTIEATVQKIRRSPRAFQGHQMVRLEVDFAKVQTKATAGDFVVQVSQPMGRLACYLLEPESNDGLVTWNFLDDYLVEGKPFPIQRVMQRVEFQVNQSVK
jgi:dipeptidyl-peptidase 4